MNVKQLKLAYKTAKDKKVGEQCTCPSCGTTFIKTNYQQAFCKSNSGTTCKDFYWNNVTPNKRNNTTRLSPANRAWKDKQDELKMENEMYDHPFSSCGLGQWM